MFEYNKNRYLVIRYSKWAHIRVLRFWDLEFYSPMEIGIGDESKGKVIGHIGSDGIMVKCLK